MRAMISTVGMVWGCVAALGLGACFGRSSSNAGQGAGQGGTQAGAGGSGPVEMSNCDGAECGYSEPCPGGFRNEPGSCCPVCVTDGEPVADPLDPTPTPVPGMEPTPVKPAPACAASAPTDGAHCDMNADAACSDGGFGCSCQCECVSNQGGGGAGFTCSEPCAWQCAYQDLAFVSLDRADVDVDCSTSPATLTATVDLTFHAPADGPAMTFDLQPLRVQMEKGVEGFSCDATDLPVPSSIGPLEPGTTHTETYSIGPLPCGDPSSANPRFDTCNFGYCASPGEAWIMVGAKASGGDHESSANVNLQELPGGARIPVHCTGGT